MNTAEIIMQQKKIAAEVAGTVPEKGKMTTSVIREVIRTNEEATQALEQSMDKIMTRVKKNETRNRPIQLAEKATTFLEGIDTNILLKMNDSELRRLARQLDRLEQTISQIRASL